MYIMVTIETRENLRAMVYTACGGTASGHKCKCAFICNAVLCLLAKSHHSIASTLDNSE